MHASWGQLSTTRYEIKKPNAISEELGIKAGYCACFIHTPPPKGWADHLRHPSSLSPGHTPTVTPYTEPARFP